MLTIGQLAKQANVRTSTLRYYESEGLLAPTERSDAGYRLYDESAAQMLRFIQRAQRLGFALGDIRLLLRRIEGGNLRQDEVIRVAEARYLHIEQQVTQWLVLRHEMGLFLQDLHGQATAGDAGRANGEPAPADYVADALFAQLVERVCADPGTQSATTMLDWLLRDSGCPLTTAEAQRLLESLHGEHIHVWQADDAYHILVVSDEPQIGETLTALAQLEADCQLHQHTHQIPELQHNDEGYLLVSRGENAFVFARLFLSIAA